jgi:hypothetical protein
MESCFSLELLRRYLASCPQDATQVAIDVYEDYLREHRRSNHLVREVARLKRQLQQQKPLELFPLPRLVSHPVQR